MSPRSRDVAVRDPPPRAAPVPAGGPPGIPGTLATVAAGAVLLGTVRGAWVDTAAAAYAAFGIFVAFVYYSGLVARHYLLRFSAAWEARRPRLRPRRIPEGVRTVSAARPRSRSPGGPARRVSRGRRRRRRGPPENEAARREAAGPRPPGPDPDPLVVFTARDPAPGDDPEAAAPAPAAAGIEPGDRGPVLVLDFPAPDPGGEPPYRLRLVLEKRDGTPVQVVPRRRGKRRKRARRKTFDFRAAMPARPDPPARLRFRVQIRRLRLRGRSRFLSVVARLRWSPTGAAAQESVLRVHRWLVGRDELGEPPPPAAAGVVAVLSARTDAAEADAPCPLCAEALGVSPVRCGRCRTPHHRECWEYFGRCTTYACPSTSYLEGGPAAG